MALSRTGSGGRWESWRDGTATVAGAITGWVSLQLRHAAATDVLTRFAEDEFVVVLPHTPARRAQGGRTAQRGDHGHVPVGLAELRLGDRADDLLTRADAALYDAKHRGEGVMLLAGSPHH